MAILIMAVAGLFVGKPYVLIYKALFIVFLSVSTCMYILSDEK